MKRILTPLVLLLSLFLLLPACNRAGNDGEHASSSSSAVSSGEIRETRNVSYRGTVEPLGVSIYMQGTHSLALGDGRMLILESTDVDLEAYLGHEVEVFGALRPTVEAGGIIMRIERISDLSSQPSASSEQSVASVAPDSSSPSTDNVESTASSSHVSVASAAPSSRASSVPSSMKSSVAELEARIVLMAKQDITDRNWTQRYCTDHVGFCVPVHRNWWFVSFGNTTQTLWHVEVSSESFESMDSGPISIDLVGGELAGHSDSEVVVEGGKTTGYRAWTQGRHFRIFADARLEAAVRYMTEHLRATE